MNRPSDDWESLENERPNARGNAPRESSRRTHRPLQPPQTPADPSRTSSGRIRRPAPPLPSNPNEPSRRLSRPQKPTPPPPPSRASSQRLGRPSPVSRPQVPAEKKPLITQRITHPPKDGPLTTHGNVPQKIQRVLEASGVTQRYTSTSREQVDLKEYSDKSNEKRRESSGRSPSLPMKVVKIPQIPDIQALNSNHIDLLLQRLHEALQILTKQKLERKNDPHVHELTIENIKEIETLLEALKSVKIEIREQVPDMSGRFGRLQVDVSGLQEIADAHPHSDIKAPPERKRKSSTRALVRPSDIRKESRQLEQRSRGSQAGSTTPFPALSRTSARRRPNIEDIRFLEGKGQSYRLEPLSTGDVALIKQESSWTVLSARHALHSTFKTLTQCAPNKIEDFVRAIKIMLDGGANSAMGTQERRKVSAENTQSLIRLLKNLSLRDYEALNASLKAQLESKNRTERRQEAERFSQNHPTLVRLITVLLENVDQAEAALRELRQKSEAMNVARLRQQQLDRQRQDIVRYSDAQASEIGMHRLEVSSGYEKLILQYGSFVECISQQSHHSSENTRERIDKLTAEAFSHLEQLHSIDTKTEPLHELQVFMHTSHTELMRMWGDFHRVIGDFNRNLQRRVLEIGIPYMNDLKNQFNWQAQQCETAHVYDEDAPQSEINELKELSKQGEQGVVAFLDQISVGPNQVSSYLDNAEPAELSKLTDGLLEAMGKAQSTQQKSSEKSRTLSRKLINNVSNRLNTAEIRSGKIRKDQETNRQALIKQNRELVKAHMNSHLALLSGAQQLMNFYELICNNYERIKIYIERQIQEIDESLKSGDFSNQETQLQEKRNQLTDSLGALALSLADVKSRQQQLHTLMERSRRATTSENDSKLVFHELGLMLGKSLKYFRDHISPNHDQVMNELGGDEHKRSAGSMVLEIYKQRLVSAEQEIRKTREQHETTQKETLEASREQLKKLRERTQDSSSLERIDQQLQDIEGVLSDPNQINNGTVSLTGLVQNSLQTVADVAPQTVHGIDPFADEVLPEGVMLQHPFSEGLYGLSAPDNSLREAKQELERTSQELVDSQELLESVRGEISTLRAELEELQGSNSEALGRQKSLATEIEDLITKKNDAEQAYADAVSKADVERVELEDIKTAIGESQQRLQSIKTQLQETQALSLILNQAEERASVAESRFQELESTCETLGISAPGGELGAAIQDRLCALEAEKTTALEEVEVLKTQLQEAGERVGLTGDISSLEERRVQLREVCDGLQEQIKNSQSSLKALDLRYGSAEGELNTLNECRRKLDDDLGTLRGEISLLKKNRDGLRKSVEILQQAELDARYEVNQAENDVQNMLNDALEQHKTLLQLVQEADEAQADRLQEKTEILEGNLLNTQEDLEVVKAELEEVEEKKLTVQELLEELEDAKKKLKKSETNLNRRLKTKRDKEKELKASVDQLGREKTLLEKQLENLRNAIAEMNTQQQEAQSFATAQAEWNKERSELVRQQAELLASKERLQTERDSVSGLHESSHQLALNRGELIDQLSTHIGSSLGGIEDLDSWLNGVDQQVPQALESLLGLINLRRALTEQVKMTGYLDGEKRVLGYNDLLSQQRARYEELEGKSTTRRNQTEERILNLDTDYQMVSSRIDKRNEQLASTQRQSDLHLNELTGSYNQLKGWIEERAQFPEDLLSRLPNGLRKALESQVAEDRLIIEHLLGVIEKTLDFVATTVAQKWRATTEAQVKAQLKNTNLEIKSATTLEDALSRVQVLTHRVEELENDPRLRFQDLLNQSGEDLLSISGEFEAPRDDLLNTSGESLEDFIDGIEPKSTPAPQDERLTGKFQKMNPEDIDGALGDVFGNE